MHIWIDITPGGDVRHDIFRAKVYGFGEELNNGRLARLLTHPDAVPNRCTEPLIPTNSVRWVPENSRELAHFEVEGVYDIDDLRHDRPFGDNESLMSRRLGGHAGAGVTADVCVNGKLAALSQ